MKFPKFLSPYSLGINVIVATNYHAINAVFWLLIQFVVDL
ncbi:hypothetical protein B6N60_02271 [Richelia sinica FACHB-800]|uniref:Uncharacterized protein n=1 Tax=Richelia sinica FACHB-800 TaxID=1357546 RepID=A0A975Y4V8_9NOST|nr:hypothetical protein B6N60_02271 [Richelia sinica FACHB-800]